MEIRTYRDQEGLREICNVDADRSDKQWYNNISIISRLTTWDDEDLSHHHTLQF